VAVATGSTSQEKLAKAGPDFLLESFAPLEKVMSIFE
jgi:phosphoglycolate phosphatase-like HAD superfamily hydrolase